MKKIFLAIIAVLLVGSASADLGPKPSAKFHLEYETEKNLTLKSGEIYRCEKSNCSTVLNITTEDTGIKQYEKAKKLSSSYLGFHCQDNTCETINYGKGSPQILVLTFDDRKLHSNIFKQEDFDADFNVKVKESQLIVKEPENPFTSDRFSNFVLALFITLIIELPLGIIFLAVYGRNKNIDIDKKLAATLVSASIITLPLVWFVFPFLKSYTTPHIVKVSSELFAILAEALIIHKLNTEKISLKAGFYTSIVMNSFSAIIGILQALLFL